MVGVGLCAVMAAGCQTAYYSTMEKLGYHKRDILVSRVETARDSQQAAKEQFKSALEQFSSVMNVEGGNLEAKYNKLNGALERSEAKAEQVTERIEEVESVSAALFEEWQSELDQYSNAQLRRSSAQQLGQTKQRYAQLIRAMRRAEAKIEPVLSPFRDQVLYLKHNLNARAIASLQSEMVAVESDIAALIEEMEKSIAEADAFISELEGQPG
jgi:chromosome segregation ATPase